MNKSELVNAVVEENAKSGSKISKKDATNLVDTTLEIIKNQVKNGDKITIVGFGTFSKVERAERNGINPSTKEAIVIPAKFVAKFKPAKNFLD